MPEAAEGDSNSTVVAAAEGDSNSMVVVAAEGDSNSMVVAARERSCTIRDCECCWLYSPQIPRVAPWMDHITIRDGADNRPVWSLLVGVSDGASSHILVSRLRVARSGRILGRSDDKLELFHKIALPDRPPRYGFIAGAALAPDGRSLCVMPTDDNDLPPQALQLQLDTTNKDKELRLPDIEGTTPCMPISAAGHIWALSGIPNVETLTVVARRLVDGGMTGWRWEQAGDTFTSPLTHYRYPDWGGWFIQGYAVCPNRFSRPKRDIILVSFQQYRLFLTFAPHSGRWTPVHTDAKRSEEYLPIKGSGIYVEQHDAVYMLKQNTIYAYRLNWHGDEQLSLEPPIKLGALCPFGISEGYGRLTRLADGLLCSVWISLAMHRPCPCKYLHAIVSTFHVHDPAQGQGGIHLLHSTYRRVDMVPNPDYREFCFLQEYKDNSSPAQQDSSQHINRPSKILDCCSYRIANLSLQSYCFECGRNGHLFPQCPERPWPPLCHPVVTVNPVTITMKRNLFIICQAGSQAVIFRTGAMDDHHKPLQKCYVPNGGDLHYFESGSKIYAVAGEDMLEFSLNKHWKTIKRSVHWTVADPFIMVIRIGGETIALSDTLQVFYQTKYTHPFASWLPYKTKGDDVCRKVSMSGYAVVNDDSFLVCDAVTHLCFLFDMGAKRWRVIMPWAVKENLPRTSSSLLNGRCVFVDGFIYTCINGGLAAYELVAQGSCEYIRHPIYLHFSWHPDCVGKDMCLDYAGKNKDSGVVFFYVVQAGYSPPKHDVWITTVKIKTRRAGKKMIPVGINRVVSVPRFPRYKETIHKKDINTRCCCFAA